MGLDQAIVGVLSRFRPRIVVTMYFVAQAVAIVGWWMLLVLAPDSRVWFFPEPLTGDALMSFWLADLGLLVGGSLLTAWLVHTHNPAATAAAWFLAGAFYYPSIYCLTVSLKLGGGELGVAAMFVSGGLTLAMATVVGPMHAEASGFRPSSGSLVWTGTKALLQIIIFWGTFLFVLPYTIVALQAELAISLFDFPGRFWVGLVLFIVLGSLGLWSALCTLMIGKGTPLPTDCASVLVVTGPYRYVRNPMALAGIGQGVGVGVMWGSWPVVLYALCGALIWHFCARPIEEVDLANRFGEAYEKYRASVCCWLPRRPR